jgi:hypothetical protein
MSVTAIALTSAIGGDAAEASPPDTLPQHVYRTAPSTDPEGQADRSDPAVGVLIGTLISLPLWGLIIVAVRIVAF